ncbi:hypothetical protein [Geodermatophilus sp. SYSU D01186]
MTDPDTERRHQAMNTVTSSWRRRRQVARTRRALERALARSSSPSMRDELLTMANGSGYAR